MSRRVVGRSFKITKNQAKGYGYAKARSMKANPGVTTIAAINGRGSYRGRSARSAMSGLNRNARAGRARRKLTEAEKRAFKARMAKARGHAPNRSTSSKQSATSKRNIRKAQSARKAWGRKVTRGKRIRVGSAAYGRKPKARKLKAGVYIANRRKKAGSKTMARRRKRASTPTKKRRSSKRRRKSTTKSAAAPKRRRRRKAARKGAARKRTTARKTVRRRRRKASAKLKANPKRRRRSRKAAATAPKRRRKARRATTGRKRRVSRKRRSSSRRRKGSARRKRAPKRRLKANRRRRHRRNPRRKLKANSRRRRSSGRRKSHRKNKGHKANRRRRHRRNGRKLFKMNGVGDVLKLGGVVFGGFAVHRLLTNLFSNQVLARLLPAPAAPAPTAGFDLSGQRGLIASLVVGAGTAFVASKVIKNPETRKLAVAGVVASTVHGVVLSLLKAFAPSGADRLAGPEDGTAARLSAMYGMRGLGAGASIMPRYGVINGVGEYFREPMNGLGEYFREPMNGLGEYISATSGLGTYEQNGDLYQAAAGMGSHDYQGNHIDPSGDLDRQLTIAEAAAGVGAVSPFEAAAGIGPMQAAAGMRGFGAIDTVPSGDTWIPGSVDPQLWAGVQSIDRGQSATEMTPAGVLQTDGGQGIFG
jgi:hypothetical protein